MFEQFFHLKKLLHNIKIIFETFWCIWRNKLNVLKRRLNFELNFPKIFEPAQEYQNKKKETDKQIRKQLPILLVVEMLKILPYKWEDQHFLLCVCPGRENPKIFNIYNCARIWICITVYFCPFVSADVLFRRLHVRTPRNWYHARPLHFLALSVTYWLTEWLTN